jgi:hypothetical protein
MAYGVYELRAEAYVATILEIFAEVSHPPSHVRERRLYRVALRTRDRVQKEVERARLSRHADKFLRRRYFIEPLPPVCACAFCRAEFSHGKALSYHARWCPR